MAEDVALQVIVDFRHGNPNLQAPDCPALPNRGKLISSMNQDKPLIIQSDGSLLLDVHHAFFEEARGEISAYAELEKSPEHLHTYRLSPLSLWNAASAGWSGGAISASLRRWSRYETPGSILIWVDDILSRWGKLKLVGNPEPELSDTLLLEVSDLHISEELRNNKFLSAKMIPQGNNFILHLLNRGTIKATLIRLGFPVIDIAPLQDGEVLRIKLRKACRDGRSLVIRDYQNSAAQAFLGTGEPGTGFGTVVMPCGSGKTMVGMVIMANLCRRTLILTTNTVAVHQWRNELLDKTDLEENSIAEYTGSRKQIGAVTIATYQILTWRKGKDHPYPHFDLFRNHSWGLIIYDEVHLLPAPVFKVTAELQAVRRLGLTATLIREDGGESDVFSLVGPKRYDVPWKELETSGWIAEAQCREIRIALPDNLRLSYAMADRRRKIRIAAENPRKIDIALQLVKNHPEDSILIIGQYISQLEDIAKRLGVPLVTGKTPNAKRETVYNHFRKGGYRIIVVSKIANFAIDLPDASMAIQLSGAFGSRQEEAQRLGRILRPKQRNALFCSLVSRGTTEENFALNRQRFLTEQGYRYTIDLWEDE